MHEQPLPPVIYNLYPKLIGSMDRWIGHFDRIRDMRFNWIYINPVHVPGFSGSDYAVKDHFLYHPMFTRGWPLEEDDFSDAALRAARKKGDASLAAVCREAGKRGMNLMMDLVINHTSIDSPLIRKKPAWFKREEDGSVRHPGALHGTTWVAWGDLADVDNESSPDRDALWAYWLKMLLHYCRIGVRGFRCDAAYHVPEALWRHLIGHVKDQYPDTLFLAETLGCTPKQLIAIGQTGFDCVMNSFSWWNMRDPWFLKDYQTWAGSYPSLTFPENHDTERFAAAAHGNPALATAKYALGAYFCAGIATTVGFEYGFRRKIDVVQTNPDWWEQPAYDISAAIARINEIKRSLPILQEDRLIVMYDFHMEGVSGFTKTSADQTGKIFVAANETTGPRHIRIPGLHGIMGSNRVQDLSHGHRMGDVPDHFEYGLQPGEVKLLYAGR